MSYLQYVLAKVRESDIDQFRKKVEPIERERDKFVHDQGLEHLDDIMQRRSDKIIEQSQMTPELKFASERNILEDQPINVQEKAEDDKSTEDVFAKFLQTIRG